MSGARLPLPGLRQSVYRAEFLAGVRALKECQPREVVSECKGVVKAVQVLQQGRRTPKGRHRDIELQNFVLCKLFCPASESGG
eukprot:534782-Amphidinium_carterae.1